MSHEWNCRCPACTAEWDHVTLEKDDTTTDEERARYEALGEGGHDAARAD